MYTACMHAVRIPDDLWDLLSTQAREERRSVNSYILTVLEDVTGTKDALTQQVLVSRPQMDTPIATSPTIRPEAEKTPTTWQSRHPDQTARDELLSKINKPKKS